ncbi:MAG TPA: cytochrome P450 [Phenylobacterium sp.]
MNAIAIERRFRPACPERPEHPPSYFQILFGEHSRNAVVAWPKMAFELPHHSRRIGWFSYHTINDPDLIAQVLLEKPEVYTKPDVMRRLNNGFIDDSLFMSEGQAWRTQRRVMAPTFAPAHLGDFAPIFVGAAQATAERWAGAPGPFDVCTETTRTTFEVISRALFSGEHGLGSDEAAEHVANLLASVLRPGAVLGGLGWLDQTRRTRKGRAAQAFLVSRLTSFIAERQHDPDPPQDFVTRLLHAFAQDHAPQEAARLTLHNAILFLVAGHETTSHALAWSLYLLSEDAQAQAWASEEARAVLSEGGASMDQVGKLIYLRMVLEEAMRLYPPAPRIERQATQDDRLGDLAVKKGDLVGVWPWIVHRHKRLWDEPDLFNPENFSPEAKEGRRRFQYIPFGAGPRICIGAQFAMAEALLILAEWVARFEFAPEPGHVVEVACDLTLKPKGGLPLRIRERD